MTRARLEALQWFGLLAAPLAWATQLVAGFYLNTADCGSSPVDVKAWDISLAAVAAAIAITAQTGSVLLFQRLRSSGVGIDDPGPRGRLLFFAMAALVGNTIFFTAIVLTGLGTSIHTPCQQS